MLALNITAPQVLAAINDIADSIDLAEEFNVDSYALSIVGMYSGRYKS
jgi:hypothetical protein